MRLLAFLFLFSLGIVLLPMALILSHFSLERQRFSTPLSPSVCACAGGLLPLCSPEVEKKMPLSEVKKVFFLLFYVE